MWGAFSLAIGGIDTPIKALCILITIDFITGIAAGYKTDSLSSKCGSKGLFKKIGIFIAIMLAYVVDCAMAANMLRGMVISGFAIIEAMSIVENTDRMGYGFLIPDFLRSKLIQIADEKKIK